MAYPIRPRNLRKEGISEGNVAALRDLERKITELTEGQANSGGTGALVWNSAKGTYEITTASGSVFAIGEDLVYYAKNTSGSTIPMGTPVMFTGAVGASGTLTFSKAVADGSIDPDYMMGVTLESVPNNGFSYVKDFGLVRGFRTDGVPQGETWVDGTLLYFSPAAPGTWTKNRPSAPSISTPVAVVVNAASGGSGSIFVRMVPGQRISNLSDVYSGTLANGKILIYDSGQSRWEANTITAGTGISITNGAGAITITNSSPASAISLTGAGTTTIAGTSPNFTISSSDQYVGTVTSLAITVPTGLSVSGSPITSSGTFAISLAAGYSIPTTASQSNWDTAYGWGNHATAGYLTSFTETDPTVGSHIKAITTTNISNWNTAYGWGNHATAGYLTSETYTGTVTSVSGTGTVNGITLTGTVTSSGSLTLGGTLSNVSLTSQVSGTLPVGNGGTGTATAFTAGSVVFAGASGVYTQDNANFFWDDTNNRLGIGTNSPSNKLDLFDTSSTTMRSYSTNTASSTYAAVHAGTGEGVNSVMYSYQSAGWYGLTTNHPMLFITNNTERLRLTSSGNFGIGTSSPNYKLEVFGGPTWARNFAGTPSSPTETQDWPVSAFNIASYGDFTLQTMLAFTLPSDGNYFTGYSVWNFKLDQTASSTTSAGVNGIQFGGPGYLAFMPGTSEKARITSAGKLLVGTTSTTSASVTGLLQVESEIISKGSIAGFFFENRSGGVTSSSNWYGWYNSGGTTYFYNPAVGNIASINSATGAYTALSDAAKKKDFEPSAIGLDAVLALKPTLFRMETDADDVPKQLGFVAQEVKDYIPQAYVEEQNVDATGNETVYIGLNDRPIIAALVKAVQDQQLIINELNLRLSLLEDK